MHARQRLTVIAVVVSAHLLAVTTAAQADGTGDAWSDGQRIGAGAQSGGTGVAGAGSGGTSNCVWERLDAEMSANAEAMSNLGLTMTHGPGAGTWYRKICLDASGLSTATLVWAANPVDLRALAQQAADSVPIPRPTVRFNPTEGQGAVVNVPTWLWVDRAGWRPVSAQAAAGGVVVTATATPRRVVWDMGNGQRVTCAGPGTPYDTSRHASQQSTDCSYTYRASSAHQPGDAYAVTATVVWTVTWTAAGAPGGGALGTVPQSQTVPLPVKEIQALNQVEEAR